MLCAVNTPHWGGRGREQEREKGQSHWAERGWSLNALRNPRTNGSRRTHAAPTGRDFYRGSGTNVGLAVLGCSKAGSLLSLSGGAVTLGDIGVSGVSFQTPAKSDCCVWLTKALPRTSHVLGCNLKVCLSPRPGAGCSKASESGMRSMALMLFWIRQPRSSKGWAAYVFVVFVGRDVTFRSRKQCGLLSALR